jgi:hypothetical protein
MLYRLTLLLRSCLMAAAPQQRRYQYKFDIQAFWGNTLQTNCLVQQNI